MRKSRFVQKSVIIIAGAVVLSGLITVYHPLASVAYAKGVIKTTPKDNSADTPTDNTQTQNRGQSGNSSTSSDQNNTGRSNSSTSSNTNGTIFNDNGRSETRSDNNTEPQIRDNGTPDVSGQYLKRNERQEPDYKYRKHYVDPFYHPYDFQFYSYYPSYNTGRVIIIDQDTWGDNRGRWHKTYEYQDPAPGSLDEALVDIEATWMEGNAEFIMWHVDPRGEVRIYTEGKYSHSLTPREMYKLTDEAISRMDTLSFDFTDVQRRGDSAGAFARHEYRAPDGKRVTAYLAYNLEKVRNRWVIQRIDISKKPYGSPKCFIATAAYGSPMEKDVLVLRSFRDQYLLTNPAGRVFVSAYYRVSPPLANWISGRDGMRWMVREVLWPVVQICKLVLR